MKRNKIQLSRIREAAELLNTAPTEDARIIARAIYNVTFNELARNGIPVRVILKAAGILPTVESQNNEVQS